MAGIYIHIPFCKQACYYCDFHFSTSQHLKDDLVDALGKELEMQKKYFDGEPVNTIYFGGGTPSLLAQRHLESILNAIHRNFDISQPEVTLEANPDDLSTQSLTVFREVGINRLSIGIQSFDDSILKFLNRAHSSMDALRSIGLARDTGFNNINVDLIFAIPGQDDNMLKRNIEKTIAVSPEHISAYSLTIEERTVFGHRQKKGLLSVESEEIAAIQMEILMNEFGNAGYEQYEISNFCKPGFYSRHNTGYWQQKKYLGVGPGAHSYNGFTRQYNIRNNPLYLQSITQNKIPAVVEVLSPANKINEYLLTTLRTTWGCNINYLVSQFNYDLLEENDRVINTLLKHHLVVIDHHILKLTQKGKLLADKIVTDLLVKA